jgi:ribosome biogenesis protein UTP30
MSQDDTLDSHVSAQQCKRAVEALHAHQSKAEQKRGETELLPGKEQFFWLVLAVKKIHPTRKVKPYRMYVACSLYLVR